MGLLVSIAALTIIAQCISVYYVIKIYWLIHERLIFLLVVVNIARCIHYMVRLAVLGSHIWSFWSMTVDAFIACGVATFTYFLYDIFRRYARRNGGYF